MRSVATSTHSLTEEASGQCTNGGSALVWGAQNAMRARFCGKRCRVPCCDPGRAACATMVPRQLCRNPGTLASSSAQHKTPDSALPLRTSAQADRQFGLYTCWVMKTRSDFPAVDTSPFSLNQKVAPGVSPGLTFRVKTSSSFRSHLGRKRAIYG